MAYRILRVIWGLASWICQKLRIWYKSWQFSIWLIIRKIIRAEQSFFSSTRWRFVTLVFTPVNSKPSWKFFSKRPRAFTTQISSTGTFSRHTLYHLPKPWVKKRKLDSRCHFKTDYFCSISKSTWTISITNWKSKVHRRQQVKSNYDLKVKGNYYWPLDWPRLNSDLAPKWNWIAIRLVWS